MKRNNQDITYLMRNNRIVLEQYKNNVKCYDAFPTGYKKLDFISSDGDAYINTGFTFPSGKDDSIEFIINMFYNEYTTTNKDFVFGGRASSNSHNVSLGLNQNGGIPPVNWAAVGAGNHAERYDSVSDEVPNTWYKYEILKDKLVRNGSTLWTYQSPRQYFYLEYPICLFGLNEAGTFQRHAKVSIKDFEILDDGKTIHYFHAALRLSDGKPGMLDLVTGQFYTNQGTGEFYYEFTPEGYTKLNWIKNNSSSYINTGIVTNQDYSIYVDAIIPNVAEESTLCGMRNQGVSPNIYHEIYHSASKQTRFQYADTWNNVASKTYGDRQYYKIDKNILKFADQTVNAVYKTFTATHPLFIFCSNNAGSPFRKSKATVFRFITKDNGVTNHDMLPMLRLSDNKPGLYDIFTDTFYVNQGSEEFDYSPKIITLPTPRNITYDGTEKQGISESVHYTVTNNSHTNAGIYTSTVSLVDKENTKWLLPDGTTTTDDQIIEWTIRIRDVGIYINTRKNRTYKYDGQTYDEIIYTCFPDPESESFFDSSKLKTERSPYLSLKNAGTYTSDVLEAYGFYYENDNPNLSFSFYYSKGVATFSITPRKLHVQTYDNENHVPVYQGKTFDKNDTYYGDYFESVSLVQPYGYDGYAPGEELNINYIVKSARNAGDTELLFEMLDSDTALLQNYDITYEYGFFRINKRPITIRSGSATKVYDGTPLTCSDYEFYQGSMVTGETININCTGTITEIGTTNNTFDYTFGEGTLGSNYAVTSLYGTLKITA